MKDAQTPCSHSVRCLRYPQPVECDDSRRRDYRLGRDSRNLDHRRGQHPSHNTNRQIVLRLLIRKRAGKLSALGKSNNLLRLNSERARYLDICRMKATADRSRMRCGGLSALMDPTRRIKYAFDDGAPLQGRGKDRPARTSQVPESGPEKREFRPRDWHRCVC
jgi:hypothetical protein